MKSTKGISRRSVLRFSTSTASIAMVGCAGLGAGSMGAYAATSVSLTCIAPATDNDGKVHFYIEFSIIGNKWKQGENGSTSRIFKTKAGKYYVVSNTTFLRGPNGEKVAFLGDLNPDTAINGHARNDGKSEEAGRIFAWKVVNVSQ